MVSPRKAAEAAFKIFCTPFARRSRIHNLLFSILSQYAFNFFLIKTGFSQMLEYI